MNKEGNYITKIKKHSFLLFVNGITKYRFLVKKSKKSSRV